MAGELRRAFDATVKANAELVPGVDDCVIAAGRKIAAQIDFATENFTGEQLTKALYLTPHLMNVLKEMLATPASRKAAGLTAKENVDGGTLGRLRAVHGKSG